MDIIHKLNPFHRPSSSLRSSHTPTPTPTLTFSNARPSSSLESDHTYPSIDSTLPPHSYEDERYITSPAPPLSPNRKSGHHRTPSILRSLAHHPSLSALKNKSKKRRKMKDEVAQIPPLPSPVFVGRENGLKGSRSVPRDLRLSDESSQDPIPPLPLLPSTIHNQLLNSPSRSRSRSNSATPILNKQMSIRRKPAPSPKPEDILSQSTIYSRNGNGYDDFPTPESMRVRMNFEIDLPTRSTSFDIDQSPSIANTRGALRLGVDSPRRRRYMSFDQRLSPEKRKIRNLSSPADSPSKPPIAQHSYPVPIADRSQLYARSLYADSTTFFSTDFGAPPAHALEWNEEPVAEGDGLDMFVNNGMLPPGTPGGKKEDLQRGILSDGARHEKDAVRFFSRDTYPAVSPSNSASPNATPTKAPSNLSPVRSINQRSPAKHRRAESSPACSPIRRPPIKSRESEFSRAAKRSSSPFEVKLSANVTKRMSLDAFGTTPIAMSFGELEEGLEEVLEGDGEDQNQSEPQGDDCQYELNDNGLEGYEAHELSNITESPFSEDHSTTYQISIVDHTPSNQYTIADTNTKFFTPLSPSLSAQGSPLPPSPSPSPLIRRKYLSAPPLSVTNTLLEAHADHTKALKEQLRAGEFMMDVLRSENEELKVLLKQKGEQGERWEVDVKSKVAEMEVWKESCATKESAMGQLRQAMKENEEFFENLQEAHDELADRCAALEEENLLVKLSRDETTEMVERLKKDNESLRVECMKMKGLKSDKKELESVVFELRRELKWAEGQMEAKDKIIAGKDGIDDENDQLIGQKQKLEEELQSIKKKLDQSRNDLDEKEKIIERLKVESQSSSAALNQSLSSSSQEIKSMKEELALSELTIAKLKGDLEKSQNHVEGQQLAIEDQETLIKERETSIHEHEFTISTLREQLNSAQHSTQSVNLFLEEKDTRILNLSTELCSVQDDVKGLKSEIVEKERLIAELKEKVEIARFEKNERRFQSEVEIGQLHEQLEELTRSSAEREWAGRQGTEMIARLMEEKRVWEEEREELIEMINQNSLDEESASNLRDQITNLGNQLSSLKYHYEALQGELEDCRATLQHKSTLIDTQEAELDTLRLTISQHEESVEHSQESFDRQLKDSTKVNDRLRERVKELEIQLQSRENALKELILKNESVKQNEEGTNSSLKAFINEIDQLKLSETKLKAELERIKRSSSVDVLKLQDLEKKIKGLEEDKELLNVALESKELELALISRTSTHKRTVHSTPSTTSTVRGVGMSSARNANSMSYSTSRIPNTPTPVTGMDHTPLPRRLTTSTSATSSGLNRSRRETISNHPTPSATTSIPTANIAGMNRSRRDTVTGTSSSTGRVALGNSTKHNTPSPPPAQQPIVKAGNEGTVKKVERRTSLPVLVRRPSSVMSVSRRESLSRVDEV
ncbi:hypothetical protein I302_102149 [Kwoniella bestiolae CBS 10118]|uniref:Uncharacterized protein n=1 Tax=Kwoniella bestiolae CBS 10118 TaxID=1296100 RepID=A0A1B9GE84_9TREE|nr:hypothetical protein I302_00838 [Kwoniella bestiolae CBS 10118]OCF29336.1 hypothetical protein I302_00838 [Kwoniella bestiolae CBS 10118]